MSYMRADDGIGLSYIGIMSALSRAADADQHRNQAGVAIAAAEAALWIRALVDHASIDLKSLKATSDDGILLAFRATANKAIHEQIHPHQRSPQYDFFRTRIISSSFTFQWTPFESWCYLISDWPVPPAQVEAYGTHLNRRAVVLTISAAVDRLRNLVPPPDGEPSQAVAALDEPSARGRFY